MNIREQKIRLWFDMWLQKRDLGMEELFSDDAVYIESWGTGVCRHKRNKTLVLRMEWARNRSYMGYQTDDTRRGSNGCGMVF